MNRLRMKTTATLLIAIFMISMLATAIPIFAATQTELVATGTKGTEDRIVIDMPDGFKLGDLETISWMQYIREGYSPHVDVILDLKVDGIYDGDDDALVFEYAYNDVPEHSDEGHPDYGNVIGVWSQTFSDDGDGPAVIDDDAMAWATKGASGPLGGAFGADNFFFCSLAAWKAGVTYKVLGQNTKTINSDSIVLRLEIEVDNWIVDSKAAIKDITYNTEQGQTTGLALIVEPRIVRINVDRTNVVFGPILAGKTTPMESVVVRNDGNVLVDVTHSLEGPDASFYTANMAITYNFAAIAPGTTRRCDLTLTVPLGTVPDTYTAALVFWAEESTP